MRWFFDLHKLVPVYPSKAYGVRGLEICPKMTLGNPFATFKIFYVILAYQWQYTASSESNKNPMAALFDAPAGRKIGRVSVIDVSEYSSLFLTGKQTQVAVDVSDDMTYRLELDEPPPTDPRIKEARETIKETPKMQASAMQELLAELSADSSLIVPSKNEAWLIRFLRARNYDVPETMKLIRKYYQFKEENREIYDGLIPSNEKDTFPRNILTVLPRRDQSGRRIILARGGVWSGEWEESLKICRMTIALLEIGVYEPATQIAGIQFVVDMDGMGKSQFLSIAIDSIRKMIDWIQNSVPLKLQGVHVINTPFWFPIVKRTILNRIIKDIKDIFHVHGKLTDFHKMINASSLPRAYGGEDYDLYDIDQDEWEVFLKHQDKEYEKLDSYGFVVSKRKQSRLQSSNLSWHRESVVMMKTNSSRPISVT